MLTHEPKVLGGDDRVVEAVLACRIERTRRVEMDICARDSQSVHRGERERRTLENRRLQSVERDLGRRVGYERKREVAVPVRDDRCRSFIFDDGELNAARAIAYRGKQQNVPSRSPPLRRADS